MPVKVVRPVAFHDDYIDRISSICGIISGEDATIEQDDVNLKSIENFYRFLRVEKVCHKADILILHNGNLKAFWRDETAFVSLEFLGNGVTRMKLKMKLIKTVRRFTTISSLTAIKGYIASYGASNLLFVGSQNSSKKKRKRKRRRSKR